MYLGTLLLFIVFRQATKQTVIALLVYCINMQTLIRRTIIYRLLF